MSSESPVLGVHIAAGTAWLANVTAGGNKIDNEHTRLALAEAQLTPERALSEFEESFEGLLERVQPSWVALLDTGKYRGITWSDAQRRAHLEAAILIATHRAGIYLERVSHAKSKTVLGVKPSQEDKSEFRRVLAQRLDGDPPKRWNDRAPAYAAALVVLETQNA